MATVNEVPTIAPSRSAPKKPLEAGPRRRRWTADEYRRLDRLGLFENRKIELLNGDLIELTTNPPHDTAVTLSGATLRSAFGPGFVVREEKTLDLGRRQQPHPDVAVVAGNERNFAHAHPTAASLVVEVADSSLRYDRVVKAHLYARAGIGDYWIVNLVDRQLEVHRNPGPDPDRPGRFRYADVTIVPADGHIAPLVLSDRHVAVADLLP